MINYNLNKMEPNIRNIHQVSFKRHRQHINSVVFIKSKPFIKNKQVTDVTIPIKHVIKNKPKPIITVINPQIKSKAAVLMSKMKAELKSVDNPMKLKTNCSINNDNCSKPSKIKSSSQKVVLNRKLKTQENNRETISFFKTISSFFKEIPTKYKVEVTSCPADNSNTGSYKQISNKTMIQSKISTQQSQRKDSNSKPNIPNFQEKFKWKKSFIQIPNIKRTLHYHNQIKQNYGQFVIQSPKNAKKMRNLYETIQKDHNNNNIKKKVIENLYEVRTAQTKYDSAEKETIEIMEQSLIIYKGSQQYAKRQGKNNWEYTEIQQNDKNLNIKPIKLNYDKNILDQQVKQYIN